MKLLKRSAALVVALFIASPPVHSQTFSEAPARVFTLQEAIDYALQKSYSVKPLGSSLKAAQQNLLARKAARKLNAQLQLDLPRLNEQLLAVETANDLPAYTTRGTLRVAGALNINKPLPTNGLFTLSSNLFQDDVSILRQSTGTELKRRDFFTSVALRFRQPLFALNTLKLGLEQARLNYESTSGRIKRTELNVVYQVTEAFYDLYRATRALEIVRQELEQQQNVYDLATKKFQAELIPEVEWLQTEVDLAQSRNRVLTIERELHRQEDIFKQTIGMPLAEKVQVQADIVFKPFEIDLNKALEHGLKHRSELRERAIDRRLNEIDLKYVDARSQFKMELSAYLELTGVSDPTLPYGLSPTERFRSSWNDLQDRPNNRGALLSVSMPLWDSGVNAAEVSAAQADLEQSDLALADMRVTVEREIKDVVARVLEAQNRLQVLAKSQKVAERSNEISLARFDNGDI
ncbi:MAG: TolC family protein, partial [bacterium]